MTLSGTETMQSFISHFNQYSLEDQFRATFPAGVDRGLTMDLESYDAEFDTTVILEWKQQYYYFPPRQAQM